MVEQSASPIGIKDSGEEGGRVHGDLVFKMPDLGGKHQRRARPVIDLIEESLPLTLLLNIITIPILTLLSVWSGICAATRAVDVLDVGGGSLMPEPLVGAADLGGILDDWISGQCRNLSLVSGLGPA